MADPVVLSASSIATFLRCGQQWFYAYVERIVEPPSIRQSLGIAAHHAIERNMSQKTFSGTDLPEEAVVDSFSDQYDHLVVDVEADDDEDPGKAKDDGVGLIRLHHRDVAPKIQPFWVEEPVQFSVNGIPYSGTIDLVDDKNRIRDWKTTKRKPQQVSHLLQMTGYALAYRHRTGEVESEVVLDYLIRTKLPQYLPVASGGPIDGEAVIKFANVVENVYAAIQEGRFLPNGLMSNACSWCGYKNRCPAYNAQRS